ncbi:MAG: ABC transporter ATP-binding protein [Desulfurococcales archaeon]|nr:ABC transporter ATP-binding protein [Desulfurococcales archaeon]
MSACTVQVKGLTVHAGGLRILGVEELSWGRGMHGVIGPNGSGKTTLLRTLSGVIDYRGTVEVCGHSPKEARSMVSYMPSTPVVDPLARARDVIEAGLYGVSRGLDIEEAAEILGVRHLLDRRFSTLSGGEQRLVCIARAIARRPRLLLLDEPLSFLDLKNSVKVLRLLRELSSKITVIATSHEVEYVSVFDDILVLRDGSPAYIGASSNIPRGVLEEVYGVGIEELNLRGKRVFLPRDPFKL